MKMEAMDRKEIELKQVLELSLGSPSACCGHFL